ncbi:unnamed protein product [Psylliodes chrysocephalus]|uniref:Uncharacterized protein n=1 Tax=Psylliodes chrysocephalus TaxID=3402493 RepID=A0A9P0GKI8_9CUCU|nr:unnamed protein product [Psylliodes chrysocephala]
MLTTAPNHTATLVDNEKEGRSGNPVRKPQAVFDYNKAKKGVDFTYVGSTSATENVPEKQQRTPISRPGLNKKRKINDDLSTEVLTTKRDHFKAPREQPDRYDLIGKTAAVRLRSLGKRQALIAEKTTNDVLFEAEMGYLITSPMDHYNISARHNPNTTQTTPSTFIGASISETQNNGSGQSLYSHNNSAISCINNSTQSTAPSTSRKTPSSLAEIHYSDNSTPSYFNNMSPSPTLSENHYSQNSSASSYFSHFSDV